MQAGKSGWPTKRSGGTHKQSGSGIISVAMTKSKLLVLLVCIGSAICAHPDEKQAASSVSFTVDFPGANPSHYEIMVENDGNGTYSSNGSIDEQSEALDPTPLQFKLSEGVRGQIFDLAKRSHYFAGKIDSGRKDIANTGVKTLTYKDASHNSQATYNYSPVTAVAQLTSVFQELSTTMEFGRRLVYFHKYEKLALDDELKKMEELQKENSLGDVQTIAAILREIADDSSVINVSRARTMRLLQSAGK